MRREGLATRPSPTDAPNVTPGAFEPPAQDVIRCSQSMRADQELSQMAEHVSYELGEFYGSLVEWNNLDELSQARNRTLESVLLHFRNLRGFFVDTPQRDDVSARDYVPSWSPSPDPVFDETKYDLN